MTVEAPPDVELGVILRLRDQLGADYDIATTLGSTLPAITVELSGGVSLIERVLDQPRVALSAWASKRADALTACGRALAALVTAATANDPGWTSGDLIVYRCFTTMRPSYLFDPVAEVHRYIATVALTSGA